MDSFTGHIIVAASRQAIMTLIIQAKIICNIDKKCSLQSAIDRSILYVCMCVCMQLRRSQASQSPHIPGLPSGIMHACIYDQRVKSDQ